MSKTKSSPKIARLIERSPCPIASTLDLIGDKWTLLVIRDMLFLNKKSFNEFLTSPEKIATNILTERLKRLEEHGLIAKRPYRKAPVRFEYILTARGRELKPLLVELIRWGNSHIEGTFVPPKDIWQDP